MATKEERKLFSELKKRGVVVAPELLKSEEDEVRNTTPWDVYARTTPVTSASPKQIFPADAGNIDTGTTVGRANPYPPLGGSMPPSIPGQQLPEPTQQTGSNLPGSTIRQLPPVTAQYPGQVIAIPQSLLASSKDAQEPDEAPIGSPRTAGGQAANDPKILAKTLAQQLKTPVVMPGSTQERTYTDPSRASPFESPLVQPVPMAHQHAGTIPQQPIRTPSSQVTRYPGDFNKPNPLPMSKPEASDSDGVQKNFPPGFLDANVPKKRIISQVVESNEGE